METTRKLTYDEKRTITKIINTASKKITEMIERSLPGDKIEYSITIKVK